MLVLGNQDGVVISLGRSGGMPVWDGVVVSGVFLRLRPLFQSVHRL